MEIVNRLYLEGRRVVVDKVFMDFIDEDFFKEKEFNVNTFMEEHGDIEKMSSFDVLDRIRHLKDSDRKVIFSKEEIRNKLKYGLIDESKGNQWHYYREILKVISSGDFLSLYNVKELKEIFSHSDYGHVSVFFGTLCEKDVNQTVEYVLEDNEMLEYFLKYCGSYSFVELEYDLFKEIVLKVQNEKLEFNEDFLIDISVEHQKRIIKEPEINDDTLVWLLSLFRNAVKSEFFMNDPRASYLYSRFDIINLVKNGIKFNDDILKKKDFFDRLKKDSFIEFRSIINDVVKYNNPLVIEDRLKEYYDELVSCYDMDSGLFKEYKAVLDNPKRYEFDNSFVFDFDAVDRISCHLKQDDNGIYYYEDKDKLEAFLRSETSKKLSEVIIDALFSDNIYNVWLNIKEMIRYNNGLNDSDRILNNDKVEFYDMILNFDKVSNEDKISLYKRLKNTNFSLMFYEDLRKVKDKAYDRIKDNLIKPSLHPEYIDKESADKYGVQVYDLRDKKYTMLVRTQAEFREIDHYRRGCYSIISNENTQVFGEYDTNSFLYGYNSFDNDMVLHMFESDSFSSNVKDEGSRYVNRIMTSDELALSSTEYSEIQLVNSKSDKGKYRWNAKRPDFIVVFEHAVDRHIEEAKRLGIPIVVITKKKLDKKDIIDVHSDDGMDTYVRDRYSENEHRSRR